MIALKTNYVDLEKRLAHVSQELQTVRADRERLEKANGLLEESVRVAQDQKGLMSEEHDKIQNMQQQEIVNLKNLLLFKDQEAVDRMAALRQGQQQLDLFKGEFARLQSLQTKYEDVQVG